MGISKNLVFKIHQKNLRDIRGTDAKHIVKQTREKSQEKPLTRNKHRKNTGKRRKTMTGKHTPEKINNRRQNQSMKKKLSLQIIPRIIKENTQMRIPQTQNSYSKLM